jgi:hypothetical protein
MNAPGLLARALESPSLMAWAALAARTLYLLALLPLILRALPAEAATVWFAFVAIAMILAVCDLGFGQTLTRLIAYSHRGRSEHGQDADWGRLRKLCETARPVYLFLTIVQMLAGTALGTWYLQPLVAATHDPTDAWIAWAILAICIAGSMYGSRAGIVLSGLHRVAAVRGVEALTALLATLCGAGVVLSGSQSLAALVLATQAWPLVGNALLFRHLRRVGAGHLDRLKWQIDPGALRAAWPAAWRSQIGMLMGSATMQGAGLAYARVATAAEAAPMLLALRLLSALIQFSAPPFYTRVPNLATYVASNDGPRLFAAATTGMAGSAWTFAGGAVAGGLLLPWLLEWSGSRIPFVSPLAWAVLACAFYLERVGSMHLQLCAATNRVNWHVGNSIAGVMFWMSFAFLLPVSLEYAVPASMLLAYGFLTSYALWQAHAYFSISILALERKATFAPSTFLATYFALVLIVYAI